MMLLIRIGTLDYIAPEILDCPEKQHPGENKNFTPGDRWYDNKVDVWSCGIMAYDLLTGKAPFTGVRTGDVAVQSESRPRLIEPEQHVQSFELCVALLRSLLEANMPYSRQTEVLPN